jgi:hypothetical protein
VSRLVGHRKAASAGTVPDAARTQRCHILATSMRRTAETVKV